MYRLTGTTENACRVYLLIVISLVLSFGSTAGAAHELAQPIVPPDVVFEEVNGLVAVEAEHFYKQTLTDVRQWYIIDSQAVPDVKPNPSPSHVEGASGGAYIKCLPDTRVTHADRLIHGENFSNVPGKLAILHYKVHFNTPGRYYVWVRCYSTGTEDNGIHVGLNGDWPESGQRLQWCQGKHSWRWESKQRTQEVHCGVEHGIYLDIPSPGIHDIQFSMREDGFEFDKFIMTMDRDFSRPEDAGPETRLKSGTLPPPFGAVAPQKHSHKTRTRVELRGEQFFINGEPTYAGQTWQGHEIEGLLMNARMVQGIFDDLNPETVGRWAYPDTGTWCPERNTDEFVSAMRQWRRHGLLCAVVNLQGGSPEGYSRQQPWHNSAIRSDGSLRPDYMARLERIIDRADELGMVIMVGIFYFGQDQRLAGEDAIKQAVINTVDWIAYKGYTNVLIEIANEHNNRGYNASPIIQKRPEELVVLAKQRAAHHGINLPVSCSLNGGHIPSQALVDVSDYILLHGNGVQDPARMVEMIKTVRNMAADTPKPIVNNEDDRPWRGQGDHGANWGTEGTTNNFVACARNYASWGYFDFRQRNEDFNEGFQSVPANWQISSDRKRAFFHLLAEITGADAN